MLNDIFPDSTHVMFKGLDEAADQEIWNFARKENFTIVTKDSDFYDFSALLGSPPKIIWLRIGNSKVNDIEILLRSYNREIKKCLQDTNSALIEIK